MVGCPVTGNRTSVPEVAPSCKVALMLALEAGSQPRHDHSCEEPIGNTATHANAPSLPVMTGCGVAPGSACERTAPLAQPHHQDDAGATRPLRRTARLLNAHEGTTPYATSGQ